jgi:hypothetical protein
MTDPMTPEQTIRRIDADLSAMWFADDGSLIVIDRERYPTREAALAQLHAYQSLDGWHEGSCSCDLDDLIETHVFTCDHEEGDHGEPSAKRLPMSPDGSIVAQCVEAVWRPVWRWAE